jgi:Na+/H+ antiporter NhaD/arsenite permease-like protein
VCVASALMTAVVSLDGAVVLMVPLLLALVRRHEAPLAPLLLGTVAVCNAASIAVPQGNPTNLVVIERLGIAPSDFLAQMLLPGAVAAVVCAVGAALFERQALARRYPVRPAEVATGPLTPAERHMIAALAAAALCAWLAPLAGVSPCWPFAAVAATTLIFHPGPRPPPAVPVRLAAQLIGLLVLIGSLELTRSPSQSLFAVAGAVTIAAALTNNLPASVSVGSLLGAGPSAFAATIGLGVGALATPQGSVATLLAADLAGPEAQPLRIGRLAPLALAGVAAATLVLHA